MAEATTEIQVRLPSEVGERLDRLAASTGRSRIGLAVDAIRSYVELQEWQIAEIEKAIEEADAGRLASEAEVNAVFRKWSFS